MAKFLKKLEQSAGLIGKVFNNLTTDSDIDAPSINAVRGALYRPNLLVNGDFQVNQRGQSEYSCYVDDKTENSLDMWYLYNHNAKVVKLDKGVRVTLSDIGEFGQRTFIKVSELNNITICIKLNSTRYVFNYENVSSMPVVNGFNQIIKDIRDTGITISVFELPYSNYLAIFLKSKDGSEKTFDIEYIDLFEGDIDYLHKKEDYVIALMRCQEHVLSLKGLSLTIGFGITASAGIIGLINTPVSFKSLPSVVIKGELKFVIDGVDGGTINDTYVRGLTSNGVCIDFKSSDISRIGSGKVVRVYFGDDTSSLIITNETV